MRDRISRHQSHRQRRDERRRERDKHVNVAGGGETNVGNNTATDPTTINTVSDVRIAKTHTGNFTVGVNGTYTLTASNAGNGATAARSPSSIIYRPA